MSPKAEILADPLALQVATLQHRIGAHRGLDRGVLAVVLEEDGGGGTVEVEVGDHWLAGVAPCPARWPYSEFKREPMEKLLERVRCKEPGK